jgi:hypothetical protein
LPPNFSRLIIVLLLFGSVGSVLFGSTVRAYAPTAGGLDASHPAPLQTLTQRPPWRVSVNPDTIYIRPPQCEASFTVTVTVDQAYKTVTTNPLTIIILKDPGNPNQPTGFLFDGSSQTPSRSGDWQTTVTPLFGSPWESPSVPGRRYQLLVVIYPQTSTTGFSGYLDTAVPVYYIVENTGVKSCSTIRTATTVTSVTATDTRTTTFTTSRTFTTRTWTYRTYTDDWWDCRFWWRWGDQQNWCYWRWPWQNLQPFDFSLDATPNQQTVKAGQSVSFTIGVKLVSGISQPVALSLSNFPSGVTFSFSPASENPDYTSALKISTDASMQAGSSVLTITGVGGGKTHTTTVGLVVARDKGVSSLSISVSPTDLKAGQSVSVTGTLSPSMTTSVELVYVRPDGFEMTKRVSTSGPFSDTVKPDIPGVWFVKARWPGDADRYASESQQIPVTVEAPPPTPPSFWDMIGGPGTLIAVIAIIIAIIALLELRSRRPSPPQTKHATRFCVKCGSAIDAGSDFCTKCGEKTH